MSAIAWVIVGVAFLISILLPIPLRQLLVRFGVHDHPNERSSHVRPTLRGGGAAPLAAFFSATVAALTLSTSGSPGIVAAVGLAAVGAGLLGLAEDVRGVSIGVRFAAQFLLAFGVAFALSAFAGTSFGWILLLGPFIVAYTNVTNFMDGINGISGLQGLIAGVVYACCGAIAGLDFLVFLGALIAATFGAFLPWNLSRPGLFLGDVGSYLLGAALAATAAAAALSGVPVIAALAPLAVYLADTFSVLARRTVRGEPILRPHRTHAYQRLTDTGLSHVVAATVVALFTAACSGAALLAMTGTISEGAAWLVIAALCAVYLALPRLRGSRLPALPEAALPAFTSPEGPPAREGFRPGVAVVVGASGFVGQAVSAKLEDVGLAVLRVSAPRLSLDPAVADPDTVADAAHSSPETSALTGAFAGADVVVNAAGLATPDGVDDSALLGANALLPAVILHAASAAKVTRVLHLSSAAVQGNRRVLDESSDVQPFSPYSRSKAIGERAFLAVANQRPSVDATVIRATSVQGRDRGTTASLKRVARSPLASVASPGSQPTVVSSIDGLADFVVRVATSTRPLGSIMLQPWEGFSARDVLYSARGSEPRRIPRWMCSTILACARAVSRVVPELAGPARRVELMWMGQEQTSAFAADFPAIERSALDGILAPHEGPR